MKITQSDYMIGRLIDYSPPIKWINQVFMMSVGSLRINLSQLGKDM